jgi:hypothetical protein
LSVSKTRAVHVNGEAFAASTAVIESGATAGSLTAGVPVACPTACRLTVPLDHKYYRVAYRNAGGQTVSRSDVVALP